MAWRTPVLKALQIDTVKVKKKIKKTEKVCSVKIGRISETGCRARRNENSIMAIFYRTHLYGAFFVCSILDRIDI